MKQHLRDKEALEEEELDRSLGLKSLQLTSELTRQLNILASKLIAPWTVYLSLMHRTSF